MGFDYSDLKLIFDNFLLKFLTPRSSKRRRPKATFAVFNRLTVYEKIIPTNVYEAIISTHVKVKMLVVYSV